MPPIAEAAPRAHAGKKSAITNIHTEISGDYKVSDWQGLLSWKSRPMDEWLSLPLPVPSRAENQNDSNLNWDLSVCIIAIHSIFSLCRIHNTASAQQWRSECETVVGMCRWHRNWVLYPRVLQWNGSVALGGFPSVSRNDALSGQSNRRLSPHFGWFPTDRKSVV
mgnify:CR=1 FL=1